MILDVLNQKKIRVIFISTGFLLVFIIGSGWYNILSHNNIKYKINTFENSQKIAVNLLDDGSAKDSWQTGIKVPEDSLEAEIFTGKTHNCIIENKSKFDIRDWALRININQDCYLNGFWCGDFEVHQFRNGEEIVERINNSHIDASKLILELNKSTNNLLIHLIPGDYLVYYPSVEAKEDLIKTGCDVGIGFIFYSQENMNFADFEFSYHQAIKMVKTVFFKIYILCFLIWFIALLFYHALIFVNKKYVERTQSSIRSISIMADIYKEVHILNLNTNTGYAIKGDHNSLLFNFIGADINEYFAKYIEEDCEEDFKIELKNFLNLDSIKELMNDVSSISFEYISKKCGWCSLRLFRMDKSNKISQIIFAVQDINAEKNKKNQEYERAKQNEFSQLVRNSFIGTVQYSTEQILNGIVGMNQQLVNTAKTEEEKLIPVNVIASVYNLELLQKTVVDMFALEGNSFVVKNEAYNLYALMDELDAIVKYHYINKPFEFQKVFDKNIPETLEGDGTRIKQILMLILVSSFMVTETGYVKFSIFAKQKDDYEELLFSIRDTAKGFTAEQLKEVYAFLEGTGIHSFDNPALVYLKIIDGILKKMDSCLKVTSVEGDGSEFYFSLKQKIVGKVE